MGLFTLVIIILLALMLPTLYAANIGAPWVATYKKALKPIFKMADLKQGQLIYDLGSGTGHILIKAAKDYQAKAVGFELSPPLYLFSKINIFLNRAKNTHIYFKNFYKQDISQADIIFCFLSARAMCKLKNKFNQELKPGTKIISYIFEIPGWKARQIFTADSYGPVYLYIKT